MSGADAEADLRRLAERRVRARFGFWTHAFTYLVVNSCLVAVNLLTTPHIFWSVFPILGWGVGLLAHGVSVYAWLSGFRERAVDAEMQRLRQRHRPFS
jgi:hypothetical protein